MERKEQTLDEEEGEVGNSWLGASVDRSTFMHTRGTRSNKDIPLVNLSNEQLAELERTRRKARDPAMMENANGLVRDDDGTWRDREGHLCNARGQRIDGDGNIILPAPLPVDVVDQNPPPAPRGNAVIVPHLRNAPEDRNVREPAPAAGHGRTLGDYNRPEQFYENRSAIRAPAFQRNDFELKSVYYTLLEPGSLTTWEETRNAFLHNFFDDARSEELRTKISTFSQDPTEAFKASWVRFKSYQRDCPHHGFSDVQLLGIFFRGIDWRYPDEAVELIKNLASSNSTKNADLERKKQAGNMDRSQIAEVKAKLDSVHSLLVGKKSVRFAQEVESFEPEDAAEEEDVNFVSGSGFQGQRFGNQQGNRSYSGNYSGNNQRNTFNSNQNFSGYTPKPQYQKPFSSNSFSRNYSTPSSQPQNPDNEMKSMLEQILEGQQKLTVDFNGKMDALYLDLNGKIEVLNTHVKQLDTQVAQTAGSVKRQEGFLPGKTDTNPRHHCSAITLRSGKNLSSEPTKTPPAPEVVDLEDSEEIPEIAEPVTSDTITSVARHQLQSEAVDIPNPKSAEEKVYKPKVPYPRSPRKSKQELDDARCKALMEKLVIEIPLVDAVKITPVIRRYVKRMVTNNLSHEQGVMMISEQVSAVIQNRIPEKLVNLMPYSVAVNLGMTDFKPTRISLILADRSTTIPEGVLEDVPIKVGDCMIPTDFVVLEYGEEPKDPLILGRPFLATAGAIIDVRKGRIALNVGDLVMNFDMDKLMKKPSIDGQTFYVDTLTDILLKDVGLQRACDAAGIAG
ncbi:uncharacterized protein LOC112089112 [Eutrema salsugineum]|uniref:uncharacterized protein LOC112089112 n=1 Tax=Eutrema salsugineum TaxID=72664 RepID=UPI000CED7193|nr:uncharacterized protein LOC112089112 [Eutrema salsugineum]